jgi:prepilin-type N-terminal cleavage/methylation domain-containing protein
MNNRGRAFSDLGQTPRGGRGFTLLELLVAMAVMSLMLAILLQATASILNLWRASEGKISAGREGHGATQLIRQDLQSVFVPTNTNLWPQLVGSTGIRFLALKPRDFQEWSSANVGDVCLIEYRFESNAISRGSVDSAQTFAAITNSGAFPTATNFQMVATNVVSATWMGLRADGLPAASGQLPRVLRLDFQAAPSAVALSNFVAGINTVNQQVGSFTVESVVPVPR